jgi:hypothetical protein
MLPRLLHFLRPTFIGLIVFAAVIGVVTLIDRQGDEKPDFVASSALSPGELEEDLDLRNVVLPRPSLKPEEVVKLQLDGLGNAQADGVGILQCYCFASPANRAVTGPLENFGRVVRQAPFLPLASPRAVLIGRPQYDDRIARLLVTVIDDQSQVQAFAFFLTRQREAPFTDCWMTEAVFPALTWTDETDQPPAPAA